jgi:hypothetical protein
VPDYVEEEALAALRSLTSLNTRYYRSSSLASRGDYAELQKTAVVYSASLKVSDGDAESALHTSFFNMLKECGIK